MTNPAADKAYIVKFGVLAIALAAYFFLPGIQDFAFAGLSYLRDRDFEGLREFILSYGIWAPVTSIALMTIQSMVPVVPGIVITITNAWIFGWQLGSLYSWAGALLGAILDFIIARWYGRPIVERIISSSLLDRTDDFFRENGVLAVFITRLIPIIPFKVISYGAGLTTMSLRHFVVATGIGQTPAIMSYSFLGQYLTRSLRAVILVTSLFVVLGISTYYFRHNIERHLSSWKNKKP